MNAAFLELTMIALDQIDCLNKAAITTVFFQSPGDFDPYDHVIVKLAEVRAELFKGSRIRKSSLWICLLGKGMTCSCLRSNKVPICMGL